MRLWNYGLFFPDSWTTIRNVTSPFSFTALRSTSWIQCLFTPSRMILTLPGQRCWNCAARFPQLNKPSHSHLVSSRLPYRALFIWLLTQRSSIKMGWQEATLCWANAGDASRSSRALEVMHHAASLIHNLCYTNNIQESEHPSCFTALGCAFIFNLTVTL